MIQIHVDINLPGWAVLISSKLLRHPQFAAPPGVGLSSCLIKGKNATLGGFKYGIPYYKLKSVQYAKSTALLGAVSSC
jgi:hypothetical protein